MTQRPDQPPEGFMQDEPVPDIPMPPEDEQRTYRRQPYGPPPYMPYGYGPYQEQQTYSWQHVRPSNEPLEESIVKSYWRPAMAWQYFFVCIFDFLIAPGIQIWFYHDNINNYVQWVPITLTNGGVYHIAMGTIIGIYVWSRGREKIDRIER